MLATILLKRRRGFSLAEVLVTTVVITIVASIAVPTYLKSAEQSRENRAAVVLRTIRNAQEQYFIKERQFTSDLSALGFNAASIDDFNFTVSSISANAYVISARRIDGPQYTLQINQNGVLSKKDKQLGASEPGDPEQTPTLSPKDHI